MVLPGKICSLKRILSAILSKFRVKNVLVLKFLRFTQINITCIHYICMLRVKEVFFTQRYIQATGSKDSCKMSQSNVVCDWVKVRRSQIPARVCREYEMRREYVVRFSQWVSFPHGSCHRQGGK